MRKKDQDETVSDLLEEVQTQQDEGRLNEIYAQLSNNPFFGIILDRIAAVELKAQQFDAHEHKSDGSIVLRT